MEIVKKELHENKKLLIELLKKTKKKFITKKVSLIIKINNEFH